jgi:hypothetical protein
MVSESMLFCCAHLPREWRLHYVYMSNIRVCILGNICLKVLCKQKTGDDMQQRAESREQTLNGKQTADIRQQTE